MHCCDVVGYTFDGEFVCSDCWKGEVHEEVGVVFAGSEWDYYPHCLYCGEECESVSLTSFGADCVRVRELRDEAAAAGDQAQVELCDRAVCGDSKAMKACLKAIADAEAMED